MGSSIVKSFVRMAVVLAISSAAALSASASRAAESSAPAADPAVAQVQSFCDALLDSMKRAKELGLKGRYDALKPVIDKVFNLPEMTKIAVGPTWTSISPADQKALIDAFERMTVANYASNFDGYSGEKFVVDPEIKTTKDGKDKLISSKLVSPDNTSTAFVYRMREADGSWKAIDVLLDGYISQMAQRRSDFSATITTEGAAGLIKKVNELADKQMKGA